MDETEKNYKKESFHVPSVQFFFFLVLKNIVVG